MSDAVSWFETPLAVVDVETTGLDPENDRVIEIAVIQMVRGEETGRFASLVHPGREVPAEVTNITGITNEDLSDAPPFETIAQELHAALEGRAFVAYNLGFDRAFVAAEFERCQIEWATQTPIDPLVFARELHKKAGSKRLGAVAERLGISLENAHRAADDALVAGQILYAFRDALPANLEELLLLQGQWATSQENEMAGWRSRKGGDAFNSGIGSPSAADRNGALGPAYLYGDDTDPVRAMFAHLPDSGGRR
ncbi:MAG: DNA polymerase III subunit epsilon [Deltaproteobacteria bacterium]|nr:DNA polymerase III subunit epsilon [Deltaproteobacteria bacterium]